MKTVNLVCRILATTLVVCCAMVAQVASAKAAGQTITEFSLSKASRPTNLVAGADGNVWFIDDGKTPAIGRITPGGVITEFSVGLNPGSSPGDIVLGPDGNVWFDDQGTTPAIGRITPSGVITEFSSGLGTPSTPTGIVKGPDGNLWFIDETNSLPAIGRITPSGVITEFSSGLTPSDTPSSLVSGPDGNLWFTETDAIGQITPGGVVTLFNDTPPATGYSNVTNHIAVGSDGNLWFVNDYTNGVGQGTPGIGRITTGGAITLFTAGLQSSSLPLDLVRGPDANLWFIDGGRPAAIGQITPAGVITEFSTGLQSNSVVGALVSGPGGDLWFTDLSSAIGQLTPSGVITEFKTGLHPGSFPDQIVTGPDGNLWFTDPGLAAAGGTPAIGRVGSATPTVTLPAGGSTTSSTLTFTITCAAGSSCAGTVTLTAGVAPGGATPPAGGARVTRRARPLTLGSARFSIRSGKRKLISIHLRRKGRAYVRAHHRRFSATALVSQRIDGHAVASTRKIHFTPARHRS